MSFSSDLDAFAEKSLAVPQELRRAVGIKLFGAVIKSTPVEEGRLRGNWQITGGTAAEGELARTTALSSNQIVSHVTQISEKKALIMTNNLPYAQRIEFDGWSHTKAPAGMVRHNVSRFKKIVGEELRKLK